MPRLKADRHLIWCKHCGNEFRPYKRTIRKCLNCRSVREKRMYLNNFPANLDMNTLEQQYYNKLYT